MLSSSLENADDSARGAVGGVGRTLAFGGVFKMALSISSSSGCNGASSRSITTLPNPTPMFQPEKDESGFGLVSVMRLCIELRAAALARWAFALESAATGERGYECGGATPVPTLTFGLLAVILRDSGIPRAADGPFASVITVVDTTLLPLPTLALLDALPPASKSRALSVSGFPNGFPKGG